MWPTRLCRSYFSSCIKARWTWSKPSCSRSCQLPNRCKLKDSRRLATRKRRNPLIRLIYRSVNFTRTTYSAITINITSIPVVITLNITDKQHRLLSRRRHPPIITRSKVKLSLGRVNRWIFHLLLAFFRLAAKMGDSIQFGQKRPHDQSGMGERMNSMKMKRHDVSDSDMNDSIDNMTSDDIFLPQAMQPQVTINESPRYEATAVKRESSDIAGSQPQSPNNAFRNNSYRKL